MNRYQIYSTLICALLSGCGGGGGGESDNSAQPTPPATTYAVSANDTIHAFKVNDIASVDLKPFTASSDGGAVHLKSLEVLGGDSVCHDAMKDKNGFSLKSDNAASCVFKYTVANEQGGTNSAISRTVVRAVSEEPMAYSVQLPPLSLTISEYTMDSVDVSNGGLTLTDNIIVLGSGTAVADVLNNTISYDAQESGISRILYEMKDSAGAVSLGSVDVAVSQNSNTAPVANSFVFPESPQVLKPGEEVLIDVASKISDPDVGDTIQLYDVHSFNGVAQIAFPADVTNTHIRFKSYVPDDYYISYTVTDHNGGFATNIIKVSVEGFFTSIHLVPDELYFNAPLSAEQATQLGLKVTSFPETNIPGSNGVYNAAAFNNLAAKGFCAAQGARLPTAAELTKLQTSGKAINYWPTQKYYWSSSQGTASGTSQVVNIESGAIDSAFSSSDLAYVTCINQQDAVLPGGVTYDMVLPATMQTNTAYTFSVTYKEADNILKTFTGDVTLTGVTPANPNISLILQSAGKYRLYSGPTRGSFKLSFLFSLPGHPLDGVVVNRNLSIESTTTSIVTPPPPMLPGEVWLQQDFDFSAKTNFFCGYRFNTNTNSPFALYGLGYTSTDFAGKISGGAYSPRTTIFQLDNITKIRITTANTNSNPKRRIYAFNVTRVVNGTESTTYCGEQSNSMSVQDRVYTTYNFPEGKRLTGMTVYYMITPGTGDLGGGSIGALGFEITDI
ncbi:hypothetical protein [Aeromonas sobria]|uniref:hypothetical protein n=1 Tax=Aeromonas sobria TaxID=646 RepID=UPI0026EC77AB|nr:hypothetical protein [Aeromonas sobria]